MSDAFFAGEQNRKGRFWRLGIEVAHFTRTARSNLDRQKFLRECLAHTDAKLLILLFIDQFVFARRRAQGMTPNLVGTLRLLLLHGVEQRLTIFGPGDFGAPKEAMDVATQTRMRLLIQHSDWFRDYYRPFCGEKVVTWFAGIDTDRWADWSGCTKLIDVLIYDKIRWYRTGRVREVIDRLTAHLDARGLSYSILRYGHHHQGEFADALKSARSMAFICEHETQGLAYQEALAANVPVFAWDEGEFIDPILKGEAEVGLGVTSVPYFDDRCGSRFMASNLESEFDLFWARRKRFQPRNYVLENLSMRSSAEAYLRLYRIAGGNLDI